MAGGAADDMNCQPLCIIQARLESTRLPRKMLLPLGGETIIARGWRLACEAFGKENCVVAIPATEGNLPLYHEVVRIGATYFQFHGDERDVMERFHRCAHWYRWRPDNVIFRWTPDDFRKAPEMCRRVAVGERLPVEQGGEAFTLAMLDEAHADSNTRQLVNGKMQATSTRNKAIAAGRLRGVKVKVLAQQYGISAGRVIQILAHETQGNVWQNEREHLTYAFSALPLPEPPDDGYPWSVDSEDDYRRAREWVERHESSHIYEYRIPSSNEIGSQLHHMRLDDSAQRAYEDQPGNVKR